MDKTTYEQPSKINDEYLNSRVLKMRRFVEIGRLVTYSDQRTEKWSWTRFCVVKLLDDNSLWIISRPEFPAIYVGDGDYETAFAQPMDRAFPLDGFKGVIACARLEANVDSLQEYGISSHPHRQGVVLHRPDPPIQSRFFEIEQVHSGGFVIGYTYKKD